MIWTCSRSPCQTPLIRTRLSCGPVVSKDNLAWLLNYIVQVNHSYRRSFSVFASKSQESGESSAREARANILVNIQPRSRSQVSRCKSHSPPAGDQASECDRGRSDATSEASRRLLDRCSPQMALDEPRMGLGWASGGSQVGLRWVSDAQQKA